MELKSREREINESKIALSRLRQQLERTELEVQKEKDLRLRTNVDLAQILRQQAAIGAYSSSLVQQAQHQQLMEKETHTGAFKRPKFLHVSDDEVSNHKVLKVECKSSASPTSSPCPTESSECLPLREIPCSKKEEEAESDEDSTTAAPNTSSRLSSSSPPAPTSTTSSKSPLSGTAVKATRPNSRDSAASSSPLGGVEKVSGSAEKVQRQSTLSPPCTSAITSTGSPCDPRSTPSPSYSNESSSTLVIVDS